MEEEKKESRLKALDLSLIALIVVGVVLGFALKKTLKPKITSSPEDRKIFAVKQDFDFDAIQKKLDDEMAEAEANQAPVEGAPMPEGAAPQVEVEEVPQPN